jgi:[ribosomal protein S5]-alanine N-acetyltransferase
VSLEVPTLVGERCVLRELRPADAESLRGHADDEAVWRNLFEGFPRPYTLEAAQEWCGPERDPLFGHVWGIEVEGTIVGCIGLRPDQAGLRCNAEIGYWLGRALWRRGIGSEALELVTQWAWATQPELTRLYAPIYAWNEGSQAVARKAGYVLEARLPQSAIKAGRVIDRVQYAAYRHAPQAH